MSAQHWLPPALGLAQDQSPLPWQVELLERLEKGNLPSAIAIPTGLGKTGVMAIWLVALASGAPVPRRLVYVVDRRAVVDQATREAVRLRKLVEVAPDLRAKLGLDGRRLSISTLRGQFADNREWLDDPASPAIIVGTVDMIGSRLLFEGYGVRRKMRPFHAGLLGSDALIVIDEAHLVPPFARLLQAISRRGHEFGPSGDARKIVPGLHVVAMSATGATAEGEKDDAFTLQPNDQTHPTVAKRLKAVKTLKVKKLPAGSGLAEALAKEAWDLAERLGAVKVTVYCDKHRDAKTIAADLRQRVKAKKGAPDDVELLVGARRVLERQRVATWLGTHGFSKPEADGGEKEWARPERPAFLVATSAGEVGVDLDADHAVADLVAWDRMVQRLGRVNRFGRTRATVTVFSDSSEEDDDAQSGQRQATRTLMEHLPASDGGRDASTGAILNLSRDRPGEIARASTPPPLRPALTRPLVEAWALTSLEQHPGRPDIQPWLRGWVPEKPETRIVWRRFLPVVAHDADSARLRRTANEFFDAAPPQLTEVLESETWQVVEWLGKRARAIRPEDQFIVGGAGQLEDDVPAAIVLSRRGEFVEALTVSNLLDKRKQNQLKQTLPGAILVVHRRFAGLTPDGLLDHSAEDEPKTLDDGSTWDPLTLPPFRAREVAADDGAATDEWVEECRIPIATDEEGQASRWLVVESNRTVDPGEDARGAARRPQLLDEHGEWAERHARDIARRVGLDGANAETLAVAARLHDGGKGAERWQRAFRAPDDGKRYAKTATRRVDQATLDGYRHEVGSLLEAERHERVRALPPPLRDLALHLIASHHGFARPIVPTRSVDSSPPSALVEKEAEIALRFARLQREWGPWGLAWWEALLRAADHQASEENDALARRDP